MHSMIVMEYCFRQFIRKRRRVNLGFAHVTLREMLSVFAAFSIVVSPLSCIAGVTERVLYSFSGCGSYYCGNGNKDGLAPASSLVADSAGNLYGTTPTGGDFAGTSGCYPTTCSTVYKLTRTSTGWKKTTIYRFEGVNQKAEKDGSYTASGLLVGKGALYGTTFQGGSGSYCAGGCGTVYRLTPPAAGQTLWNEQILWNFTGYNDASSPYSTLIADSTGALYGTYRGVNTVFSNGTGLGGVFKLTPPASSKAHWTERIISTFDRGALGQQPLVGLIADKLGNLYGVTGNGTNAPAAIFKLEPRNATRTLWNTVILHTFSANGPEGNDPLGGLVIDAKGNLYGTTNSGPGGGCIYNFGCGTVFELSPPRSSGAAWDVHVLHVFSGGADGGNSHAGLTIDSSDNLYGTTQNGGSYANESYGSGVVFEISSARKFSVLHAFTGWCCSGIYGQTDHDGESPDAAPLLSGGALFGTTAAGGTYNEGTAYELTGTFP